MKKVVKLLLFCALCAKFTSVSTIATAQKNDIYNYLPDLRIDSGKATLYRSSIKLLENEFSGILIVKNMGDLHFRCVFTTETGIKLFDYQIYKNKTKVLYGLGPLKNGMVAKHLGENISMLLPFNLDFKNSVLQTNSVRHKINVKIKKSRYEFQSTDGENLITFKLVKKNKTKLSANYILKNNESSIPWKVNTRSHSFQIHGNFQRIKE